MKRYGLGVLLCLVWAVFPTSADSVRLLVDANIHQAPLLTSRVLAVGHQGASFELLQQDGSWWKVAEAPGQVGYIKAQLAVRQITLTLQQFQLLGALAAGLLVLIFFVFGLLGLFYRRIKIADEAIQTVLRVSQKVEFYRHLPRRLFFHYSCDSKRAFYRFHFDDYLRQLLAEKSSSFAGLATKFYENRFRYRQYLLDYQAVDLNPSPEKASKCKVPRWAFRFLQKRLYRKLRLRPPESQLSVEVLVRYTSPRGKNSYSAKKQFRFDEIAPLLVDVQEKSEWQRTKEYQRSLMTDSLRFRILKRDHFTCQLCGASKADGAQLEVDHILPVSKGGQTVPDNLQTLCKECNRGKGAQLLG